MDNRTLARAAAVLAVGTAALVGAGATAASAGEITGNGTYIDNQGRSVCSYSGQNDGYHHPEEAHGEDDAQQRTQTPAGYPAGTPGTACNPSRGGGGH